MLHLHIAINQIGEGRKTRLMGREFRAFPAVLVREQVLHNNLGATFLPFAVISENAAAWNGMPVVIRHPESSGRPISARSPEVLNSTGVGFVFASYADANSRSLKAEIYLDEARLGEVEGAAAVADNVGRGKATELSTGFLTATERRPGVHAGRQYDLVMHGMVPDHLALLPDETGACSVADGCGMARNCACGGTCNGGKMSDQKEEDGQEKDVDGKVANLVDRMLAFLAGKKEEEEMADNHREDGSEMNRDEMVAHLRSAGVPADTLAALNDTQLKALADATPKPSANAGEPKGDGWDKAREWREKYEQLEARTANARASEEKERADLLDDLLSTNALPWSGAEIREMDIVQLRKVHAVAFPRAANYGMRAGSRTPSGAPAVNFETPNILAGPSGSSALDKKEAN